MAEYPQIAHIRSILNRLATEPPGQLEYLQRQGIGVDELALEFDDVALGRDGLVDEGALTLDQADALAEIDRQFTIMTDAGPSRWTEDALTSGEDWQEVRRLARVALAKLDTR